MTQTTGEVRAWDSSSDTSKRGHMIFVSDWRAKIKNIKEYITQVVPTK